MHIPMHIAQIKINFAKTMGGDKYVMMIHFQSFSKNKK